MRIIDCEQGTPEWHAARAGRVTASRVADVVTRTKSGWGASRKNYAAELVCEKLTKTVAEMGFTSAAMQRGTEKEPEARDAYRFLLGAQIETVGFVIHPRIDDAGASPDGLVGDDGLVEIKCPNSATHIETLLADRVPPKYITQMQWQMACTDRAWCDFVSYDDRLPGDMAFWCHRVERDDALISELEDHVATFLDEVAATVRELEQRYGVAKEEAA